MAGGNTHAAADATMLFIPLVVAGTVLLLLWLIRRARHQGHHAAENTVQKKKQTDSQPSKHAGGKTSKKRQQQQQQASAGWRKGGSVQFTHPELLTSLKGHTGTLTSGAFSATGKHFITAADDRTVQIWSTADFTHKEHKSVRGNIEYDFATRVCWSPDGKAIVLHKAAANAIEVYKLTKRPDGSPGSPQVSLTFPQHDKEADLVALEVAVSGRFIMSCSARNQLVVWSLKGEVMEAVDTRHGDTYSATLSPCGRFVATTGFTPDVKVWEVKFGKSGNFEGIKRAFDLTGHKAGIYSCGINSDSTRMASVSKDGTWRLFDTNIEYQKGQLVYLLHSGPYERKQQPALIRLSPDGRTIAIASSASLAFFSAITGDALNAIDDIYSGPIVDLTFDPESKLLLTLGDRHVRVFHNVAGYHATLQDLEQSHRKATSAAMRERINQQVREAKKALEGIQRATRVKAK